MAKALLVELTTLMEAGKKLDGKLVELDKDVRQDKEIDIDSAKSVTLQVLGNITETKLMINKIKPLV